MVRLPRHVKGLQNHRKPSNVINMSGVEVAGLVVGVLPILIETIKSYSMIAQGFRTFRHYSEEDKNFAVQVKVQKGIFWNEVRLLLRSIGYVKETEEMLEDSQDVRWTSQRLHSKLDNLLQHDLELYCDIIEETWKVLEKLRVELTRYNVLLEEKSQVSTQSMFCAEY